MTVLRGLAWITGLAAAAACASATATPAAHAGVVVDGNVHEAAAASVDAPRGALVLEASTAPLAAWPSITMLTEGNSPLDAPQALARLAEFKPPAVPTNNLGVRRDAVWLHLPLAVPAADDGRWILAIDYPLINEADVTVWQRGSLVASYPLGSARPYDQRAVPGRMHAAPLQLPPGQTVDVLLRLRSQSSMIAPITLHKPAQFIDSEYRLQLFYGVWFGVALAMIGYSMAHWVSLRDPMFLMYAVLLSGISIFFIVYSGLGNQHLWNDQSQGLLSKLGTLGALLGITAGGQFISRALHTRQRSRRLHAALMLQSLLGGTALVASVSGLLDYRVTALVGTAMGGYSAVLAVVASWVYFRHARDAVGSWMLAGWSCYLVGALIQAGLLRGLVPAHSLTINLLQITTLCEMLAWQHVLGLRIDAIRQHARDATAQKDALQSLAHTDPLTGLLNRRGLMEALAPAADEPLALYLLDLDGFKPINDRHGHDVGDALLVAVAQRLRSTLPSSAVVARLGGDEFVVLACDVPRAADAAQRAELLLRAFEPPFDAAGMRCEVGATIGYALAPHDARGGGALMKAADLAMYRGKAEGGRCLRRAEAPAPDCTPADHLDRVAA